MAGAEIPSHHPYAPLRVASFRWYSISLLTMTLAMQIQGLVVGYQIYQLTHDKLAIGLIGLAEALPFIATALFAGHVADTHNRRRVALWSLALLCCCSLALFALSSATLAVDQLRWAIYAVIMVSGVGRSFVGAARAALGAEVVPRELYAVSVGWRTTIWQAGAVAGPALGGLLYAWGGAGLAYAVDASLMVLSFATLLAMRYTPRPPAAQAEPIWTSLTGGLSYVFANKIIFGAMSLDLFAVLFGDAIALLPVFAADILGVGADGVGMLAAARAVGALTMSVVLTHRPPLQHAGRALLLSVGLFGLSMVAFGLSTSFPLSLAILAFSGAVDYISVIIRQTLVQVLTPDHLLGRVSAVNAIFIGSSNEIGAFESGLAARLIGTVQAVVLGGVVTLGVVAATAWRVPALARLGRIKDAQP